MSTQFRHRQLGRIFELYDVNKDGYIDAADYARVGQGFGTATGSAPGTGDNEKWRATHLGFWEQMRQAADTDHDGRVSREEFVAYHEAFPAMRETVADVAQTVLRLADRDGDGKISLAEYSALSRAYGVDAPAANEAFGHLDRDGDGFIDTNELLQNIQEFFYGDDPNAPGNWLVGPL